MGGGDSGGLWRYLTPMVGKRGFRFGAAGVQTDQH